MATEKKRDILHDLKITREQVDNSAEWFINEIQGINASAARRKMLGLKSRQAKYLVAGRMYLFTYRAETIPVFDKYPLIFPFSKTGEHFYGINLHYVPIPMRIEIINKLSVFANNQSMSANVRLVMQWNMIKALSQSKNLGIENCVKMYRNDRVQSMFSEIPPSSWRHVATLSLEKWTKR
jgi:hypothetical protein